MALSRVFVANRGEIAVRVLRACGELGIETVLGVSEADRHSLGARLADRVVCIGPASADQSYLRIEALVVAAIGTGADAVHPGYGFLAERAEFARACEAADLAFVGPPPDAIDQMGDKLRARKIAERAGIPVVPGSQEIGTGEEALALAEGIGYPILLKASAGGGGRGIKVVAGPEELPGALAVATAEVMSAFGDPRIYIERYVASARHIEVQVLADELGNVISLGERDCSLQRRYQKLVEEAPAVLPSMAPTDAAVLQERIQEAAVLLAHEISYRNAGTVEFIVDQDSGEFFFLEMNTRIQVEHPVTEEITGVDLVAEQLRIAGGSPLGYAQQDVAVRGHAIECRITAENVEAGFRPSPGLITEWLPPGGPGIRVDTHCYAGYEVPVHYDSLLAKVVARGRDRDHAIQRLRNALSGLRVAGVDTTAAFLHTLLSQPAFAEGRYDTRFVERLQAEGVGPGGG
ncbi:MAG: acetyl-CoA carboxylase biotin carboxylase subunit [Nitriliruptorales bacterium]|nr:acetyl-CoA carboxylase biotin carboxylase subunit [Nitriliruptorales bacterium]